MSNSNTQEQIQAEVTYRTFSEFLQSTPPDQWVSISDLGVVEGSHIHVNAL